MLFWIFVIALFVGIGCIVLSVNLSDWDDFIFGLGVVITTIATIALIVCVVVMGCNHIGVDGYIDQMNTRYETLVYEYENDIYENDNDIGKQELMNKIQNWNEDLARNKKNQTDFWIGIFIPNIYDQFELIELNKE